MPKWECRIDIVNDTDRDLELKTLKINWGRKASITSSVIKAGDIGVLEVFSPAGLLEGIEFTALYRDVVKDPKCTRYGEVRIYVDIPYWKSENTAQFKATGLLHVEGYTPIKASQHDYTTSINVSNMVV